MSQQHRKERRCYTRGGGGGVLRRSATCAISVVAMTIVVLLPASPASAHDPIFLADDQTTPESGPYLPDGTISFALYGALRAPGETRGFQVEFAEGDELYLSLLIPNLLPENALPQNQLPVLQVTAPDGTATEYPATTAEVFDEPFSRTSYVELFDITQPAQPGVYDVVVTAPDALRFSVAVGTTEEFGTPAERVVDRPASVIAAAGPLQQWYGTTATGEPVPTAGEVTIDAEEVDQAVEDLATTTAPAAAPVTAVETTVAESVEAESSVSSTAGSPSTTPVSSIAESAETESGADDGGSNAALLLVAAVALAATTSVWWFTRRRKAE
jgi:hypothetical protein